MEEEEQNLCKRLYEMYEEGYNEDYDKIFPHDELNDYYADIARVCILDPQEIKIAEDVMFRIKRIIDDRYIIYNLDKLYHKYDISVYIVANDDYNYIGNQRYRIYLKRWLLNEDVCPPLLTNITHAITNNMISLLIKKHRIFYKRKYHIKGRLEKRLLDTFHKFLSIFGDD